MASPDKFYEAITHEHVTFLKNIGQGAFGTIYHALHRGWGTDVAVKILNRNSSFTQEQLLNEARAMDEARFTYVLRLFGLFVGHVKIGTDVASCGAGAGAGAAPDLGLVMEYMENRSLSVLKNSIPSVPWALRVRILHQVALGMNFLHTLNPPLLHLDLKPSNVLLDGELHVRVADFGLSKFKQPTLSHATRSSAAGEGSGYGGTLEFMPPEAFADMNYKPTKGTDVYSYGILMWSLLDGREPYQHVPATILSSQIRLLIPQGQRPSTEELEKKIPDVLRLEDLIHLMKRCWHNEETQRPSFRDCSKEIDNIYLCYKSQIMHAVRSVQDNLNISHQKAERESALSRNTPGTPARASSGIRTGPQSGSNSGPRFENSPSQQLLTAPSGFEEQFGTMRLEEPPYRQNEAVPPTRYCGPNPEKKPTAFHRSQSALESNADESADHESPEPAGVMFRPGARPANSKRPRSYHGYQPYYGYQQYQPPWSEIPQQGEAEFVPQDRSLLASFNHGGSGISISAHNLSGVQVGRYNTMHVDTVFRSNPTNEQ